MDREKRRSDSFLRKPMTVRQFSPWKSYLSFSIMPISIVLRVPFHRRLGGSGRGGGRGGFGSTRVVLSSLLGSFYLLLSWESVCLPPECRHPALTDLLPSLLGSLPSQEWQWRRRKNAKSLRQSCPKEARRERNVQCRELGKLFSVAFFRRLGSHTLFPGKSYF